MVKHSNMFKFKIEASKLKRKILNHVILVRIFIITALVCLFTFLGFLVFNLFKSFNIPLIFDVGYNFITQPVNRVAQDNGRVNILILGIAGESRSYDSPDLTDTIMLVSVSLTQKNIKIISIPRDTWIPEIRAKINSAYYWGGQNTPYFNNSGVSPMDFAKGIVSEVVGVPIQYGAVIDFSGFKDIIDEIGGVNVNVANSFTDYFYPVPGRENDTCGGRDPLFMCRYQTVTFNSGPRLMNGDTALKFVRSRHAEGIEGTDIAREARQQKVIEALKNKLSDKNTYTNLQRDIKIIKVVLNSVKIDFDYPTAAIIGRKVYEARTNVESFLIPQNLLVNPPVTVKKYDGQSIFTPALGDGKWDDINKWVKNTLY